MHRTGVDRMMPSLLCIKVLFWIGAVTMNCMGNENLHISIFRSKKGTKYSGLE